jgi:hypothetical protein
MSATVPYVVGQWVRGPQLYGREAEIASVRADGRRCTWIAGLRRIGKTSLLRQLELRCGEGGGLPLFWDLQGADDAGELALSFADALLEAAEPLARAGVALAEVEDADLRRSLSRVLDALHERGVPLLLLVDEADQLGTLQRAAPELVRALGQLLREAGSARVVLAASLRCGELAAGADDSALFAAAAEPLHLGVLADDEARALVRQAQLPAGARPAFDDPTVEAIRGACGNHPMLLQLVGRRCLELGEVGAAVAQVAADRTLDHLFAVDLDLLEPRERELLRLAAVEGGAAPSGVAAGEPAAARLVRLGLLRGEGARLSIPNRFLADWLRARPRP